YTCVFCDACCGGPNPLVAQVLDELKGSAAGALNEARDMVRQELRGQNIVDLHREASKAIDPLDEFRDVFEDKIGDALINNEEDIRDVLDAISSCGKWLLTSRKGDHFDYHCRTARDNTAARAPDVRVHWSQLR
ncbi:hypothetical protein FOZ62_012006, partial [Perkinsus olseni]